MDVQEVDNYKDIADFLMRWYCEKARTCIECSDMDKAEEYYKLAKKYCDIVLNSERPTECDMKEIDRLIATVDKECN